MQGDTNVIEYVNKALRHELTAVNQYWLHYRLFKNWGYGKLARKVRTECIGEMEHADKLVDRIIFLHGHPNMQPMERLQIGRNLREALEADLKLENVGRDLYVEARDICREMKDIGTMTLFDNLITDEEKHIGWLETQLSLLHDVGDALYGQMQAGEDED
jgi:bacterioferritin